MNFGTNVAKVKNRVVHTIFRDLFLDEYIYDTWVDTYFDLLKKVKNSMSF